MCNTMVSIEVQRTKCLPWGDLLLILSVKTERDERTKIKVKLQRAQGECLGTESRRRT
jgi:hypothetical protein